MLPFFPGRRWRIAEVDDRDKVISLEPALGGTPPVFGGAPGDIHDEVVARMFELLVGDEVPVYLDDVASELLDQARRAYRDIGFHRQQIVHRGEGV